MSKREQEGETESGNAAGKKRPHRPYKKPQLAVYGKLAELTAGVGGSHADPGHTAPTKVGAG
jgi:hypothetical protein